MATPQEQAHKDVADTARAFERLYAEKLPLVEAVKTPEQLKGLLEIFYTKGAQCGAMTAVRALARQLK